MSERRRLLWSGVAGVAAGAIASAFLSWKVAMLVGWDVAALSLTLWIWGAVGGADARTTRQLATREESGRNTTRALLLSASSASLVGVLFALVRASQTSGGMKATLTAIGLSTVLISWGLVHTLFALRYAHLYYSDDPGGIDFGGDRDPPAYPDFAYLAFTVGMTFQVSDTEVSATAIRRTVLRQALLSYLFGTVIVATSINVIAGLLR